MSSDSSTKHLAHDLNNIFTRILNSIDLIKRKVGGSSELLPLLNNIEAGTYLASEMISENFGDKSGNKNQRRINLNSIISDVTRSFTIQQKTKVSFNFSLDPDLKIISGKYSDLYRVILNLITNALESIGDTGIISISTANIDDGANVEFRITDNGSGIDEATLPFIFDEDFSTKKDKNLSGIGLSIVKNIIELNDGSITVASEAGSGTEFRIILKALPDSDNQSPENGKTILIAEDEELLRDLLAELLQSYNYSVLTAANGEEVLDILKVRMPDLLIIDRLMPEMDGIECIEKMSAIGYGIPVILASGSQTESSHAGNVKVDRVINKPYNFEELLLLVRTLIG